ncbi:MAG: MFS transporter [Verrucomicrobiota bacterium]|nr:MFS transporter [Verrucomicrobiota bacterium]
MADQSNESPLWRHGVFQKLFWAHVISLLGSGLSSVALALLAHQLVGASASAVLGVTLAIRIVVIVFCSPWAGQIAERFGARAVMIGSDLVRAGVVAGFFFANSVWQIYALAIVLNLGAALFTPIYKAAIPGVVSERQYPRALAFGAIAYDTANILGPALAGLVIAVVGFRGNFVADGITFLVSAALLFGVPRLVIEPKRRNGKKTALGHGLAAMFRRPPLRESLLLALQVSVTGAFVLVATVDFVKVRLGLNDSAYAWAMAGYGIGAVCAAAVYARVSPGMRDRFVAMSAPAMLLALLLAAVFQRYAPLLGAWFLAGAAQSILGIRGNELLAANSAGEERAHIYAAHFSLSHAGWGLTYPLAGFLTTALGFGHAAWIFFGILAAVSTPVWLLKWRTGPAHPGISNAAHEHTHSVFDPPADYHSHEHRHGAMTHSHRHRHD